MKYTVDMNTHPQVVRNALEYLDTTLPGSWTWASQVREWKKEFDIDLRRGGYPQKDTMTFKSKEDAIVWILKFS